MVFEQIWTPGLAAASYLVGAEGGDAAVVDPLRDADRYVRVAASKGVRIAHILETHIHADLMSGARELAEATGAALHLSAEGGPDWQYAFPNEPLRDGDALTIGPIRLTAVHTPGHTPEHLIYLIADTTAGEQPTHALTGDFLFVGDVGRPDLLGAGAAEDLGALLYDSIQTKLAGLPDDLQVFPGHGAGSLCGKAMSVERSTTLGAQRLSNYALQPMSREAFIRTVLEGQPAAPRYFRRMKVVNRDGPPILGGVPQPAPLSVTDAKQRLDAGAVPVDLRSPAAFAEGYIPGSVNIWHDASLSGWAGAVLDPEAPLVLITDRPEALDDAARQCIRVGIDRLAGYLEAGFGAWQAAGLPVATLDQVPPERLPDGWTVLDVRTPMEWELGYVPDAFLVSLTRLTEEWPEVADAHGVGRDTPIAVMCATGHRSCIGASALRRMGYTRAANVPGGFTAYSRLRAPVASGSRR